MPIAARRRSTQLAILIAALLALLAGGLPGAKADLPATPTPIKIIVQQWNGSDPEPAALVQSLGGVITRQLPIVGGFAATVDSSVVATIAADTGVRVVSPDAPVVPQDVPPADGGPRSVYRDAIDATTVQQSGAQGQGVTVAVVDTGVANVPDLSGRVLPVADNSGAVVPCINLSSEAGCQDSYGHGTFISGLIAGNGTSSSGAYVGVAPRANIVSVKLAGADGKSSVSQVLAGIQWVVANKDQYGIRVMNLSLRTDSTLSYRLDPLNLAVERAWASGMVVVVAAGNSGPNSQSIAKPGDDPWVITVGSTNDGGTMPLGDDSIVSFSSRGPTLADGLVKPDVAVSGNHLISLRSPGSQVDTLYPYFVDSNYRRGSGTSFSAGIVSGAVAAYLSANPTATNDRIKFALMRTARPLNGVSAYDEGAGVVDLAASLSAPTGLGNQGVVQPLLFPDGTGSAGSPTGAGTTSLNWQSLNWQSLNWQQSDWTSLNWQSLNWQSLNWQSLNWQSQFWS